MMCGKKQKLLRFFSVLVNIHAAIALPPVCIIFPHCLLPCNGIIENGHMEDCGMGSNFVLAEKWQWMKIY